MVQRGQHIPYMAYGHGWHAILWCWMMSILGDLGPWSTWINIYYLIYNIHHMHISIYLHTYYTYIYIYKYDILIWYVVVFFSLYLFINVCIHSLTFWCLPTRRFIRLWRPLIGRRWVTWSASLRISGRCLGFVGILDGCPLLTCGAWWIKIESIWIYILYLRNNNRLYIYIHIFSERERKIEWYSIDTCDVWYEFIWCKLLYSCGSSGIIDKYW